MKLLDALPGIVDTLIRPCNSDAVSPFLTTLAKCLRLKWADIV